MKEVIDKYYMATDGRKFKDEKECKEYENAILKLETLKKQIHALNKEVACTEYILYGKERHIESVDYAGEGYYNKCPHCGVLVGGYEGRNTSLKVDKNIYKCEKCGKFFRYS